MLYFFLQYFYLGKPASGAGTQPGPNNCDSVSLDAALIIGSDLVFFKNRYGMYEIITHGKPYYASEPAHCVHLQTDVGENNTATLYHSPAERWRHEFTKCWCSSRRCLRHPSQRCGVHIDRCGNGQPAKHHLGLLSMTRLDFLAENTT